MQNMPIALQWIVRPISLTQSYSNRNFSVHFHSLSVDTDGLWPSVLSEFHVATFLQDLENHNG